MPFSQLCDVFAIKCFPILSDIFGPVLQSFPWFPLFANDCQSHPWRLQSRWIFYKPSAESFDCRAVVNSCKSLEEENIIIMAMLFCLIWCDLLAGKIFSAFMLRYQNIDLKSVSCREGFCVVDFLEGLGPGGTCDDQRTFATFDPPSLPHWSFQIMETPKTMEITERWNALK